MIIIELDYNVYFTFFIYYFGKYLAATYTGI